MITPPEPFPAASTLFALDPDIAYLNHGAFGAVPLPVQRAQRRLRDEMESNPQSFFTNGLPDRIEQARRRLAGFLGADADGTAFVPNATAAVGLVLGSLRIEAGDEILTTTHGYGAVDLAVDRLCAGTGAIHTTVPLAIDASDDDIVTAITAALVPDRTKLVVVDHVTSPTARVLPIESIVQAAAARKVPIMVDAAHAPGALPVDVDKVGADFWVGNLHKWLFAPRPSALFRVAPKWRGRIAPRAVSWNEPDGFPRNIEMQGSLDYTAWLAAPTGLDVMQSCGVGALRAHNSALAAYGQHVVGAALGLHSPADLPHPGCSDGSMRVVVLPDGMCDTTESAHELRQRIADELRVIVPVNAWRGSGLLRLSAQIYNRAEEYDRLAAGLPGILKAMRLR